MHSLMLGSPITSKESFVVLRDDKVKIASEFLGMDVPPLLKELFRYLGDGPNFLNPKVYIRPTIPSGLQSEYPELYHELKIPKDLDSMLDAVSKTQVTGHPVRKIEVYLGAPNILSLSNTIKDEVDAIIPRGKNFRLLSDRETTEVAKGIIHSRRVYHARKASGSEPDIVIALAAYQISSQYTAARELRTKAISRVTLPEDGLHMSGTGLTVYTRAHKILNGMLSGFNDNSFGRLSMFGGHIRDLYFSLAKKKFNQLLWHGWHSGLKDYIHSKINEPDRVEARRVAQGVTRKVGPEGEAYIAQKNKEREKHPEWNPPNKREIKVAGSIRSSVIKTVVPTAYEEERVWMRSDATLRRPDRAIGDQELRGLIPSVGADAYLKPLVSTENFAVNYGIVYDNPIINVKKMGNTFWYGNRSHFLSAAQEYAKWTGDSPKLVFLIKSRINLGGIKENTYITVRELNQYSGEEVNKIKAEHRGLIGHFNNAVKEGKRLFPENLALYFKGNEDGEVVNPKQFVGRNVPVDWQPIRGITTPQWTAFLKSLRRHLSDKLGFRLGAEKNLTVTHSDGSVTNYITRRKIVRGKDGKEEVVAYTETIRRREDIIKSLRARKRKVWDVKSSESSTPGDKDEWKNYLIIYLLGHKAYTAQQVTFMLPIVATELPGKGLMPEGDHWSVDENTYYRTMHGIGTSANLGILLNPRGLGGSGDLSRPEFNSGRKWHYIPSRLNRAFPYSRMIMPDIVSPDQVKTVNAQLKNIAGDKGIGQHPLERTTLGYRYNGYEYRSFYMFVSMPKSVAEKKFKLVSMGRAKSAINHPGYLKQYKTHLSKHRGSPMDLGITPRDSKFRGVGDNAFGFLPKGGLNPFEMSKREMTKLPSYYFDHPAFNRKWKSKIDQVERSVHTAIEKYMHLHEKISRSYAGSPEKRDMFLRKLDQKYERQFSLLTGITRQALDAYMTQFEMGVNIEKKNGIMYMNGDVVTQDGDVVAQEAFSNLTAVFKPVRKDMALKNHTDLKGAPKQIVFPEVKTVKNTPTWHAILGHSTTGEAAYTEVKAVTSDMAKLYLMYRLLRSSSRNAALGKLANKNILGTRVKMINFMSQKILFDWAASNFAVVQDSGPKGLKRIPGKIRHHRGEFSAHRSSRLGEHETARLVGFGDKTTDRYAK